MCCICGKYCFVLRLFQMRKSDREIHDDTADYGELAIKCSLSVQICVCLSFRQQRKRKQKQNVWNSKRWFIYLTIGTIGNTHTHTHKKCWNYTGLKQFSCVLHICLYNIYFTGSMNVNLYSSQLKIVEWHEWKKKKHTNHSHLRDT